jgi:hypothetical protein
MTQSPPLNHTQMAIALSSLVLTPVDGYKGCNVRPYLTRQSPDLSSIVSAVKKRRQVSPSLLRSGSPSYILFS